MANCLNCKAKLGCSCKKRVAADGKSCCVTCIKTYNKVLQIKNTGKTSNKSPVILKASAIQK